MTTAREGEKERKKVREKVLHAVARFFLLFSHVEILGKTKNDLSFTTTTTTCHVKKRLTSETE